MRQGRVNRPSSCIGRKLGVTLGVVDIIVTGAGGKLGRLLRAAWLENPPSGLRPIWSGRSEEFDLAWDILADPTPDLPKGAVVLHLAGLVRGPGTVLQRNAAMVPPLLRTCRKAAVRRLFLASTASVYAPDPNGAREEDAPAPPGAYGAAKLAAEAMLDAGDMAATILRFGNIAGADALLGPRPPGEEIVLDPVPGHSGGPLRSWIGGRTLAGLLPALVRADLPRILNVACDPPLAMGDLLAASGLRWRYGPPNPDVVPAAVLSTRRLAALVDLPKASPESIAAEAAWARGVLQ
ncbi:MAG: NAD-dependent epimerase/dehydratase family protein [Rhodobacter sp.]|nr:NAD-dependent epimerase/dehydratase family protein [Rhodobacter sp.]